MAEQMAQVMIPPGVIEEAARVEVSRLMNVAQEQAATQAIEEMQARPITAGEWFRKNWVIPVGAAALIGVAMWMQRR